MKWGEDAPLKKGHEHLHLKGWKRRQEKAAAKGILLRRESGVISYIKAGGGGGGGGGRRGHEAPQKPSHTSMPSSIRSDATNFYKRHSK